MAGQVGTTSVIAAQYVMGDDCMGLPAALRYSLQACSSVASMSPSSAGSVYMWLRGNNLAVQQRTCSLGVQLKGLLQQGWHAA